MRQWWRRDASSTTGGGEDAALWRLPLPIGRDYYLIRRHDPGEQTIHVHSS